MKLNINRIDLIKKITRGFPDGYGAEIGSFKGEFAKEIVENWGGNLFMVDVWRGLGDEYKDASNHNIHTNAYAEAMKSIEGHEDRAVMVRGSSQVVSEMFEDDCFDFVYIDANHAYDFVIQDIELWYPKVKKGGYLLGHDYIDMDWEKDPHFADCYAVCSRTRLLQLLSVAKPAGRHDARGDCLNLKRRRFVGGAEVGFVVRDC